MPDPTQPHLYPRRVLVCLSGLTPQVVTETLYALLTAPQPFVPTELQLVTTAEGARRAQALLMGEPGGPPGALARLWQEYAPPGSTLDFQPARHLHLIGEPGAPVDDLAEATPHLSAADRILAVLRPLLNDRHTAVHASLAGGRKSMSFYMGYVMSLLAREQDRLSHVLVNPPFDTLPAFAWPLRQPELLALPGGGHISTAQARVALVDIAFVKMSRHLPRQLLSGQQTFERLVGQTQAALEGVGVVIDAAQRLVVATTSRGASVRVGLSPQELGLYAMLAQRRQACAQDPAGEGLVLFRDEAPAAGPMAPGQWLERLEGQLDLKAGQLRQDWQVDTALRERVSAVNAKLEAAMAAPLFQRLRVLGPGDRGVRDGRYGLLGLSPESIHFGNAP